ncbi:MAG: LytTR family DNA-binding domain-containing protein [Bacteroidales bacterium]|nr:LytTR family DNA-binding domain-containing protein [Bacteroidales bacterium]
MIRCAIVDDEPLARDVLQVYVSENKDLELVALCKNAKEALQLLDKEKIDLLFVDIQMPEISGMSLAKMLKNPPYIIFTTAYDQYAVEGFEVSAVDYLMKPIAPERFNVAVEKVKYLIETRPDATDYMFVRADYQDVKVPFSEILYVEGLKDYVKIVTTDRRIVTLMNIKGILEKLPENLFIRVHKSYIVALNKIDSVKGTSLVVADKTIPIGLTFKDDFKKRMKVGD